MKLLLCKDHKKNSPSFSGKKPQCWSGEGAGRGSHRGQWQKPHLRLQSGLSPGGLLRTPLPHSPSGLTWSTPGQSGDLEEGRLQSCQDLPCPLPSSSSFSPRGHRFPFHVGRKLSTCLQEQLGLIPSAVAGAGCWPHNPGCVLRSLGPTEAPWLRPRSCRGPWAREAGGGALREPISPAAPPLAPALGGS